MKKRLATALAASLATACPAWGATAASASLGAFSYRLLDLDPGDGLLPALSWTPRSGDIVVRAQGTVTDDSEPESERSFELTGSGLFAGVSGQAATPRGQVRAGVEPGSAPFAGGVLEAAGNTLGPPRAGLAASYSASASTSFSQAGFPVIPALFVLAPRTEVIFSASLSLAASTSLGFERETRRTEYATASASLEAGGSAISSGQPAADSGNVSATWIFDELANVFHGETRVLQDTLEVSLMNGGDSPLGGYFRAAVQVQGSSLIPPVPEPRSYALLLAGLAFLGAWSRRSRHGGDGHHLRCMTGKGVRSERVKPASSPTTRL